MDRKTEAQHMDLQKHNIGIVIQQHKIWIAKKKQ